MSKNRWWIRRESSLDILEDIKDGDTKVLDLLEEVEAEFEASYKHHAQRLTELKEALRVRQEKAEAIDPGPN